MAQMMSHTIRYFKLVYMVAGILVKNEHVCQTLDQIYIHPRYEKQIKPEKQEKQQTLGRTLPASHVERHIRSDRYESTERVARKSRRRWLRKIAYDLLSLKPIRRRLKPMLKNFNLWTIPNYFVQQSTNFITNKFVINSDCDMIYSK